MVAALLHDIGKGSLTEHSVAGEPVAREIATRMGFEPESVELIALLVRWHLLLAETATTRDPDDPATVDVVTSKLGSAEALSLLAALTEADAKATSPKAWSSWRSGLIRDLGRRAHASLDSGVSLPPMVTDDIPIPADLRPDSVSITVEPGARRLAGDHDRPRPGGAAGRLRRDVRAAPDPHPGGPGLVAGRARRLGVGGRGRAPRRRASCAPSSTPWPGPRRPRRPATPPAGRAGPDGRRPSGGQRPGDRARGARLRPAWVVYLVCRALADLDVAVRSAHVDTLGPQAVDVFYLQEASAGALSETRAAETARAVREVLSGD